MVSFKPDVDYIDGDIGVNEYIAGVDPTIAHPTPARIMSTLFSY